MKMFTFNDCECERCELGRAGFWANGHWTCHSTGQYYYLIENEVVA